jgi:hypothetical protein
MSSWIVEGTAHRSRVSPAPVRHLLVDNCGEWSLWCSSGKGRKDYNPHSKRFCHECLALAKEAIAEETLDPSDVHGWPVGERVR